jgi:hypothetical protein
VGVGLAAGRTLGEGDAGGEALGGVLGDTAGLGVTSGEGVGDGVGDAEGDGVGETGGDGAGETGGDGDEPGEAEGEGDTEGDGVGGGVGGGTHASTTPCASSWAAKAVGAGGTAWTVRVATGDCVDASPRDFARADTRTTVPAAGSGPVSIRVSPGATRRTVRCPTLARSPGTSARSSSISITPRRAPPAVARGAP